MKTNYKILLVLMLLVVFSGVAVEGRAPGRVKRITQGIFLYSNWDAPYLTLDTCLDMTITHAVVPKVVNWYGRDYEVIEIGPGAFRGCRNLTMLEVGSLVGGFLKGSLLDCPNLRVIKINSKVPPQLESQHPFFGSKWYEVIEPYHTLSTVIVVPEGSEEAYRKAPGWKEFKLIQSHMPDANDLHIDDIDIQINNLEGQLEKVLQEERRLRQEIEALRKAKEHPSVND